jgi:hypothetical protein
MPRQPVSKKTSPERLSAIRAKKIRLLISKARLAGTGAVGKGSVFDIS